jgi:DNA-binding MarR family transcriptional regulator
LEKKGLVNKKIDEEDNRKKVITATDEGKQIQKDAFEMNFKIEEKLKEELGNGAIKSMKIQLRDLILVLDNF